MLAREIGRAIGSARVRLGLSLEELAQRARLDAAMIGAFERGEQLPSTAKLDRIAAALQIDALALQAGRDEEEPLVVLPRHAARPDFFQSDLPALRAAFECGAALLELTSALGRENLTAAFTHAPVGAEPAKEGHHCARIVRHRLKLRVEPIEDLPRLLAERFSIPVMTVALSTAALQAAAVRAPRTRAGAVVLNSAFTDRPAPGTLQAHLVDRVSVAHELCHLLFDEARGGIVDVVLDDLVTAGGDNPPIEQRARAFAAELLIPLFGIQDLLGHEGRQEDTPSRADAMIDRVRAHFRTPAEIAVNHLYNHEYVARIPSFREDLIRRAQARELPRQPAAADDIDAWRDVLVARAREAHEAALITAGAARALLRIEPDQPLPWDEDRP